MKIMLVWPTPEPQVKILLDELQGAGHEIVYWVGEYPVAHLAPKNCMFHDHYDAWDAKRASALTNADIPPADPFLTESMYATESLILTMMNKRYDRAPVDERKHIYYTMLAYWRYVFDTVKPDFVLYALVPHSIYTNIVYDLARQRLIPTLCFEDTWVALRMLLFSDFWKGSDELRAALARNIARGVSLKELSKEMQAYYVERTKTNPDAVPSYMVQQKRLSEGWGLFAHRTRIALQAILDGRIFKLGFSYFKRLFRKDLKVEYSRLQKSPDLAAPFVYVPLSFQPERTTSPQGGIYHDQILMVETLSSALPEGWRIFVKEHPSQWWLRGKTRYSSARYRGYYERLARIPHVVLVPIDTKSAQLLERSKVVATTTGTAGWESLLRGKPAIIFGIPWYRDCPGTLPVASVEDCRRAFARVRDGHRNDQSDMLAYLKALEEVSIRAHISDPPSDSPQEEPLENMRIISERVLKTIGR